MTVKPAEPPDEDLETGESPAKAALGATVTFIALVALWELLVRAFNIPGWILPAPSAIALALGEWRSEHCPQCAGHPLRDHPWVFAGNFDQHPAHGRSCLCADPAQHHLSDPARFPIRS
jgi:hypothetical protein